MNSIEARRVHETFTIDANKTIVKEDAQLTILLFEWRCS